MVQASTKQIIVKEILKRNCCNKDCWCNSTILQRIFSERKKKNRFNTQMVNQGTARSKTNLKKRLLISSKAIYIDMTTRNIKSYKVIYLQKIFTESYLTSTNILKRIAALLWSQTNVLKFLFIGISRFFFFIFIFSTTIHKHDKWC